MDTRSSPATACVLRRHHAVFVSARHLCLASLSATALALLYLQPMPSPVAHPHDLRHSAGYHAERVLPPKTRHTHPSPSTGRAPVPDGLLGFIRIDSVRQGDRDGVKGVYRINAVNCVTQWKVVACVQTIS